ncbi:hypothetical protein LINPERHAP1_LOCUS36470 [Linum perenne]
MKAFDSIDREFFIYISWNLLNNYNPFFHLWHSKNKDFGWLQYLSAS